jgi:tyrosine-protein kinase Etk/Wzc
VVTLDAQARATIQLVAELRAQIATKQAEITAMRSFATGENPELQIAEQQLAGLQSQEQKMGASSEGAENALIPKGSIPETEIEYVGKLRNVKYYETIFELMARQYEIAKVDEARQGSVVQVVDLAIVPDHHSSPQRVLITLGAMILGLVFGVGWAFGREALHRISNNPAESSRLDVLRGLIRSGKKQKARV